MAIDNKSASYRLLISAEQSEQQQRSSDDRNDDSVQLLSNTRVPLFEPCIRSSILLHGIHNRGESVS